MIDLPTHLNQAFDSKQFRKDGHIIIDLLADFLEDSQARTGNAYSAQQPEEMLTKWTDALHSNNPFNLKDFTQTILSQSTNIHHPHYMGHQVATPTPDSALMELLSAFLNNGTSVYEMGNASSPLEKVVTDWLIAQIGFPETGNGILTSGGSLGNLTALLAARQAIQKKDFWQKGNDADDKLVVFVSAESHYCVDRALHIMGLGSQGLVTLETDENLRIRLDSLEQKYEEYLQNGNTVMAVVANACSTSSGSFDPIEEIANFCQKNSLWLHIDAAHGGPTFFSKKYGYLIKGMDKASSIVMDFHKMMMMPALTTAVLFRDGESSYRTFEQKAAYLLEEKERKWFNPASRSFECTKKMMALKMFVLLKRYGTSLFEEYIDTTFDLTRKTSGPY